MPDKTISKNELLESLKLPVPNPYGTMVRIDRVNMLIERAFQAGEAQALEWAEKMLIGKDDKVDELGNSERIYTAMDIELLCVRMRNKLRFKQRQLLKQRK
ncbi:MAG: hypothetical protein RL642_293 [Bacteroidota bacterium]